MRYIKSCGFVVYASIDGEDRYLIIKSHNGDVGFPKGHTEHGESEIETAVREVAEEVNLELDVIPGFRREIEYRLPGIDGAVKRAVYFLGRCKDICMLKCQESEVGDACFMPYADAIEALTFDETRQILCDAENYIRDLAKYNIKD